MKKLRTRDWLLIAGETGLFFIVTAVIWFDEFVDLPYLLLGAPPTPYRPQEYILETASILVVALAVIIITYISLLRVSRLQKTIATRELEISRLRAFAKNTSIPLQGTGISPGMVEGVALIYQSPENELTSGHQAIAQSEVKEEISRLDCALAATISELENAQKQFIGDKVTTEHSLLDVHLAMLKDVEFWGKCKQRVWKDLVKVEQAVTEEVRELAAMLEGLKQESMREHSADIRDIGRRVLRNIRNSGQVSPGQQVSLPPNTILVAKELLLSDLLQLDQTNLAALVTERNGPASHVAILARTKHIPSVSDVKDVASLLVTGDRLLVDAEAGTVTVAPTKVQTASFAARSSQYATIEPARALDASQKCTTEDGIHIGLYANISRTDEAHLALEYGLDGVGLFRSEFLFLDVKQPPDLDTQYTVYTAVAKILSPRPVVIRTMDLGGDKIPCFNHAESDLALRLGRRGLAFSLAEKTMFRTQLQAIVRATQEDDVRIMFPLVMGVADLKEACNIVDEVVKTEKLAKRPSIGAMIETPAAVFDIDEIVKIVDFVSIGTNDLAHFILASDRQSQNSSSVHSFLHPCVLRATELVVRATMKHGIGLTVCGEAAGNPVSACLLVGMGVRALSMNPFYASRVCHVLQQINLEQMEVTVRDALSVTSSEDVLQIVVSALHGREVHVF